MVSVLPFIPLFWRVTGLTPGSILNMYAFLSLREDVPHPGDFILHQVFIERAEDLQPTDEHSGSHIIIAFIHHDHLTLEITDVMFKSLSRLYLDCEEVIVVILNLPSRSLLVIKGLLHLLKLQSACLGRE